MNSIFIKNCSIFIALFNFSNVAFAEDLLSLDVNGNVCSYYQDNLACFDPGGTEIEAPTFSNITSLHLTNGLACATDEYGLSCWPVCTSVNQYCPNLTNQPTPSWNMNIVPDVSNAEDLVFDYWSGCIIKNNLVECWSGRDDFLSHQFPTFQNLKSITQIGGHYCVLDINTRYCWEALPSTFSSVEPNNVENNINEISGPCFLRGTELACEEYPYGDATINTDLIELLFGSNEDNFGYSYISTDLFPPSLNSVTNLSTPCAVADNQLICWRAMISPLLCSPQECPIRGEHIINYGFVGSPTLIDSSGLNVCLIEDGTLSCYSGDHHVTLVGPTKYLEMNLNYLNVPAMGGIGLLALGLSMLGLGAIRLGKKQ